MSSSSFSHLVSAAGDDDSDDDGVTFEEGEFLRLVGLGDPIPLWSDAGEAKGMPMPPPPLDDEEAVEDEEEAPQEPGPFGVSGGVGLPATGLCWKDTAKETTWLY